MEYESKLSDIIASLPEVSGGFLYSPERGIYSNQAESIANDSTLQNVSLKLSKIVSMLAIHFNDTGGIRVTFKNFILFGMRIEAENWMFLLHQASLSPGMIKMTVQMALNIQPEATPTEPEPQTEEVNFVPEGDSGSDTETLLANLLNPESDLSKPLTAIQEELAIHIGPVAELVFEDAIGDWCANGTPSIEDLPEFIAMLEKEIDDEDDLSTFKESLKTYLSTPL